jgi:hypothetical protein
LKKVSSVARATRCPGNGEAVCFCCDRQRVNLTGGGLLQEWDLAREVFLTLLEISKSGEGPTVNPPPLYS